MALRKILSEKEKENLIESPILKEDIIRWYTLTESDIIIIEQNCRGTANKLGFAIQLCYLRFPGKVLKSNEAPDSLLLQYVCEQLKINPSVWEKYAIRDVTRREHIVLIRKFFGFKTYSEFEQEASLKYIHDKALQTDRAIIIAEEFVTYLRKSKIQLPSINTIERLCSEALINAEKQIHDTLSSVLSNHQKQLLDALLNLQEKSSISQLNWLKQSPQAVNSKFLLMHIKRLRTIKEINLPKDIGKKKMKPPFFLNLQGEPQNRTNKKNNYMRYNYLKIIAMINNFYICNYGLFVRNFILLVFYSYLVLNCAEYKNTSLMNPKNENYQKVEFTEIRRLNSVVSLAQYTVITSTKGIKELYMKFSDTRYSRSEPIPVLSEGEYFVVLKPELKKIQNGDIEIEKLETNGVTLNILYKEVENPEYAEKKQSDPILIIKIKSNPKKIKLTSL
ncbi:DUF4158 domain-containing protein [Chryseobacterium sp. SL1]|uniref:DUF4158 domain-containing protein n=1 Tax=Chryseobacterium sp. SL1 TaxID=2995159 RepID=UPI00227676D8|nr:DUF4158 domain-containing protein [Chryseobacterium sp. SL1]MCY1663871.1 DUF4158 domain-containing protein [Chryseobacterium sp. SL1]